MGFGPTMQPFQHPALYSKGNSPNEHSYDPSGPFQQDEWLYSSCNTVPGTQTDHRLFSGQPGCISLYNTAIGSHIPHEVGHGQQNMDYSSRNWPNQGRHTQNNYTIGYPQDNSSLGVHPMDQDVSPQPGPPQSAEISLPEKPPDVYVLDAPSHSYQSLSEDRGIALYPDCTHPSQLRELSTCLKSDQLITA
ncbi:hypothetical protein TWF192_011268 [Orbilia oligospora]|nr:hypothetical protein TWF192_011268 [Orbilia oligospora]